MTSRFQFKLKLTIASSLVQILKNAFKGLHIMNDFMLSQSKSIKKLGINTTLTLKNRNTCKPYHIGLIIFSNHHTIFFMQDLKGLLGL